MPMVTSVPFGMRDAAEHRVLGRRCGCRAGSSFRSAALPRPRSSSASGFSISRRRSPGKRMKSSSALPIRLVVVSWPALRMKMQFCSSSVSVSLRPSCSPRDQPRQQVLLGIARMAAAILDQPLQIGGESRAPRRCRAPSAPRVSTGSSAPRIASDQPRSGPRSACGTPSRLPMISTGMAAAKSSIRSARPFAAIASSSRSTSATSAGLHLGDDAVRQRHLDRAAHMGVQRRIVEHEAGGVVLEQRRIAVFRAELDLLVGGEHPRVAVDRVAVAPARDADRRRPASDAPDRARAARGNTGTDRR